MIAKLVAQTWVHVAVAFMAMGGWALYANWGHPMPKPFIAAVVQGTLSGCITLGLKSALDALRQRMSYSLGVWVPPLLACSISICVLVGVHLSAGTPEVFKTIVVPFSVATTYAVAYNFVKWKRGSV